MANDTEEKKKGTVSESEVTTENEHGEHAEKLEADLRGLQTGAKTEVDAVVRTCDKIVAEAEKYLETIAGVDQGEIKGLIEEMKLVAAEAESLKKSFWKKMDGLLGISAHARQERRAQALAIPDNPKIIKELGERGSKIKTELEKRIAITEKTGKTLDDDILQKVYEYISDYSAAEKSNYYQWQSVEEYGVDKIMKSVMDFYYKKGDIDQMKSFWKVMPDERLGYYLRGKEKPDNDEYKRPSLESSSNLLFLVEKKIKEDLGQEPAGYRNPDREKYRKEKRARVLQEVEEFPDLQLKYLSGANYHSDAKELSIDALKRLVREPDGHKSFVQYFEFYEGWKEDIDEETRHGMFLAARDNYAYIRRHYEEFEDVLTPEDRQGFIGQVGEIISRKYTWGVYGTAIHARVEMIEKGETKNKDFIDLTGDDLIFRDISLTEQEAEELYKNFAPDIYRGASSDSRQKEFQQESEKKRLKKYSEEEWNNVVKAYQEKAYDEFLVDLGSNCFDGLLRNWRVLYGEKKQALEEEEDDRNGLVDFLITHKKKEQIYSFLSRFNFRNFAPEQQGRLIEYALQEKESEGLDKLNGLIAYSIASLLEAADWSISQSEIQEQLIDMLLSSQKQEVVAYVLANNHGRLHFDHFTPEQEGLFFSALELSRDDSLHQKFIDYLSTSKKNPDLLAEKVRVYHSFARIIGFFHEHAFNVVLASENKEEVIAVLEDIPKDLDKRVKVHILNTCETWVGLSKEKRDASYKIIELLNQSPSQEIKRIANELIPVIVESDDPVESWKKIESVFIKNNLPLVGKVYKIFEILHPAKKMEKILDNDPALSPYLRQASQKRRTYTIFSDLLRIHVESGNRSLRQYLEVLKEGEAFFGTLDDSSGRELTTNEQKRLQHFVAKLHTIFSEAQLGVGSSHSLPENGASVDQIKEIYSNLRRSLSVRKDQSMSDRAVELFASKLGYETIDDVLDAMREKKQTAHERGLQYMREASGGHIPFSEGDLLKGVSEQYIGSILQNGSVAKEYLGGSSGQDMTPYDTDVAMLTSVQENSFSETISHSIASGYGNILLAVRDRGQFIKTSPETSEQIDPSKLELFRTGVHGDQHYGIRTGFPTTEIDFIVSKKEKNNSLFLEIAQNGYYIPVVDQQGKIIFTPEQYESLRGFYAGLDRFDGDSFPYAETKRSERQYNDVKGIRDGLDGAKERIDAMTKRIQSVVAEVLEGYGVRLKDNFDTSILGAELLDTGSTGRHTNLSDSFDFDLALKIDLADENKVSGIIAALKEKLKPETDNSHGGHSNHDLHQLRFEGAHVDGVSVDIDIAFVRKTELSVYGSHDAVKEKLDWIEKNKGANAWKDVVANILVAKQVLKKSDAYKKYEHGGMGGIGVENWILAHGGNFDHAAKAFWQAAHDESGNVRALEEFHQQYQVIDPGINVKFQEHDNFIRMLKEQGYQNMLKALSEYFELK